MDDRTSPPQQISHRAKQEAIAWFTRINGEPSSADRLDFERWRTADPAHDEAYSCVTSMWTAAAEPLAKVAAEEAPKLSQYLETISKAADRRRRQSRLLATAGALLAFVLGGSIWLEHPNFFQNLSADFVTARAERQTITLPDGTTVLLDADSALAEEFDDTARRVRLLRGAAYFDVTTSTVPFIVDAGEGETRVTGTAFSVELNGDDVAVKLARGSVTVSAVSDGRQARLEPGQAVSYSDAGLGDVRPVIIDEAIAWRDGRLIFDGARLADVVAQLERYRAGRILLLGSTLPDHRVSGNLPLDDPDGALDALQATVGFRMHALGGRLVVVGP